MAKEWAKGFYASEKWRRVRVGYISHRRSIDGGLCEECKERLGYIVHHKEELTPLNISDASISLNQNNLEYVCKQCHDQIHDFGRARKEERAVWFDDEGNPRRPPVDA